MSHQRVAKVVAVLLLAAAASMALTSKVEDKGKDSLSATRAPLTGVIVERGSVEAVESSAIVCRLQGPLAVIKWVIEDGSTVKKGDTVAELDTLPPDRLSKQKEAVAEAEADQKRAGDAAERIKKENDANVQRAETDHCEAESALREYMGSDPVKKDALTLQVNRNAVALYRVKLQGSLQMKKANDLWKAEKCVWEVEKERQREIEKEIADSYVLKAPRDGVVYYFFPECRSFSFGRPVVAQGEPVRDRQKLLIIHDLDRMVIRTFIAEGQIDKVRVGQAAKIRVDAFPNREWSGRVSEIAKAEDQAVRPADDKKAIKVTIAIDGECINMRPDMSAEATIRIGQ